MKSQIISRPTDLIYNQEETVQYFKRKKNLFHLQDSLIYFFPHFFVLLYFLLIFIEQNVLLNALKHLMSTVQVFYFLHVKL